MSNAEQAPTRIVPSAAQSPATSIIARRCEGFIEKGAHTSSGRVPSAIPRLDIDPFAFFENPYPAQAALRDAGSAAHLNKWNVYSVARYAEVRAAECLH
jgi:hypothetical protein